MKFVYKNNQLTVEYSPYEENMLTDQIADFNESLLEFNVPMYSFSDLIEDLVNFAETNDTEDLTKALYATFINYYCREISEYTLRSDLKADDVNKMLQFKNNDYEVLSNNIIALFDNCSSILEVPLPENFEHISKPNLENMISNSHLFNTTKSCNESFKYYLDLPTLNNKKGDFKREYADRALKKFKNALKDDGYRYDSNEIKNKLYKASLEYRTLKKTHDSGFWIINIFRPTWHHEKDILKQMRDEVRNSTNDIFDERTKEEFVYYLEKGSTDGYKSDTKLGLHNFDCFTYSPMIPGLVLDKVLPKVDTTQMGESVEEPLKFDSPQTSRSISVDELRVTVNGETFNIDSNNKLEKAVDIDTSTKSK